MEDKVKVRVRIKVWVKVRVRVNVTSPTDIIWQNGKRVTTSVKTIKFAHSSLPLPTLEEGSKQEVENEKWTKWSVKTLEFGHS